MPKTAKKAVKKATATASKKPAKKKSEVTKKAAVAAQVSVRKSAPVTPIKTALNKTQVLMTISEYSGVSKKDVSSVFEVLTGLMSRHLCKGGAGEFALPGLLKCIVKRKPATKARKGISPFTGEEITFKAKPAWNIIKVRPLKKLKEMAD